MIFLHHWGIFWLAIAIMHIFISSIACHTRRTLPIHSINRKMTLSSSSFNDRTIVEITKPKFTISHSSKLFFIGSCFSEVISYQMKRRKFHVCANPFGIVFNPISIADTINRCLQPKSFTIEDVFVDERESLLQHSWSHHSSFSSYNNSKQMLNQMNHKKQEAYDYLQSANVLVITLGTAFVHRLKETGRVVANCHKRKLTY
jgi:hypothetical protein